MGISLEKFCDKIEEIIEKKEYVENTFECGDTTFNKVSFLYVENSSRFLNYILEKKFHEIIEPIQRIVIRRSDSLEFCDYKDGNIVLEDDFLYIFKKEKPLLCFTFDESEEGKSIIRVIVNRTKALTEEELNVLENLLERLDLKISEKYFKVEENREILS